MRPVQIGPWKSEYSKAVEVAGTVWILSKGKLLDAEGKPIACTRNCIVLDVAAWKDWAVVLHRAEDGDVVSLINRFQVVGKPALLRQGVEFDRIRFDGKVVAVIAEDEYVVQFATVGKDGIELVTEDDDSEDCVITSDGYLALLDGECRRCSLWTIDGASPVATLDLEKLLGSPFATWCSAGNALAFMLDSGSIVLIRGVASPSPTKSVLKTTWQPRPDDCEDAYQLFSDGEAFGSSHNDAVLVRDGVQLGGRAVGSAPGKLFTVKDGTLYALESGQAAKEAADESVPPQPEPPKSDNSGAAVPPAAPAGASATGADGDFKSVFGNTSKTPAAFQSAFAKGVSAPAAGPVTTAFSNMAAAKGSAPAPAAAFKSAFGNNNTTTTSPQEGPSATTEKTPEQQTAATPVAPTTGAPNATAPAAAAPFKSAFGSKSTTAPAAGAPNATAPAAAAPFKSAFGSKSTTAPATAPSTTAPTAPPATTEAGPAAGEVELIWRCVKCNKPKDLKGPHLKGKVEVRSDCWPCAKKTTYKAHVRKPGEEIGPAQGGGGAPTEVAKPSAASPNKPATVQQQTAVPLQAAPTGVEVPRTFLVPKLDSPTAYLPDSTASAATEKELVEARRTIEDLKAALESSQRNLEASLQKNAALEKLNTSFSESIANLSRTTKALEGDVAIATKERDTEAAERQRAHRESEQLRRNFARIEASTMRLERVIASAHLDAVVEYAERCVVNAKAAQAAASYTPSASIEDRKK